MDKLDDDDAAGERARRAAGERIQQTKAAEFHSLELVLGIRIEDSAVIVREHGPGEAVVPGALSPHAWLGAGRSLDDELGRDFTLLRRRPGTPGVMIERAARTRGVPLKVLELDGHDPGGPALALIRPDQYVAWTGNREPGSAPALIDRVRGAG